LYLGETKELGEEESSKFKVEGSRSEEKRGDLTTESTENTEKKGRDGKDGRGDMRLRKNQGFGEDFGAAGGAESGSSLGG
jgi:hypothetical protein